MVLITQFIKRMKLLQVETIIGVVALLLVRSTPDRVVRVRALAGVIVLCSQVRHCTLTVRLFTQVYKWVLANMLGVSLRWTSIPSRGEQQYSQSLHANETGVKRRAYRPLGLYKGLLTQRTTYKIQFYSSHNSSSTRNYYRLLSVSCLYTYTDVSFWLFLFQSFGIGRKGKKN